MPNPAPYTTTRSQQLFSDAQVHIPGGVNSPVRAFRSVGGTPLFFDSATGAYMYDADGNRYIDYVLSWGPMILGHRHPAVLDAIRAQLDKALSFGTPTAGEIHLADKVCQMVPGMDMVRMVNSGTEATMSAIRLARGFTGRDKIVKFEGCYHGHSDSLLIKAGSGALTLGVPSSPGVPACLADHTITLSYNDSAGLEQLMAEIGEQVACIIFEPVVGNMNCVPPVPGFLQTIRNCCDASGALMISDEVMTGFRIGPTTACDHYGVVPDLITLGKVIGGGMPVGAFGGRREVMEQIAPLGPVYQAGTLSGNPVAMAAGLATLNLLDNGEFLQPVAAQTTRLVDGLAERAAAADIPFTTNHAGTMWGFFFTEEQKVVNYSQVMACDTARFGQFFHGMLAEGIYLAPASYEAGFMSAAHSDDDINQTLDAAERVFATL